jgi:hypothetical protein
MKDGKLKVLILISCFYGSIWGIAEASLGYLFHLIPVPGFAGFFMFPIAFYFMRKAYLSSGNNWGAVIISASVAASLKLINLFFPIPSVFSVINPSISIIMEALLVIVIFRVFNFERDGFKPKTDILKIFIASFGWRALFLSYHLVLFVFAVAPTLFERTVAEVLRFAFIDSSLNTLIIAGYILLENLAIKNRGSGIKKGIAVSPLICGVALAGAFAVQVFFAVL